MSRSVIDEKVVEMRFDNSNFERNVKESMTTLEKLRSLLSFKGAEKGLQSVSVATQNTNGQFNSISQSLETITRKMSFFGVAGFETARRIAGAFYNTGVSIAKSLSTDNIVLGWQKLQNKANSMSTLLSQGYDLSVVEKQMERLLWFSDETSYNFTDMIDNISKFTASGKGLTDSVEAMQGIALWAAKSGQNARVASAAMYQLSQALSAGYMRREDWRSVQIYNMDTQEFRKTAIETAIELKTLKKVGTDTYKSLKGNKGTFNINQFPTSLTEEAWFTSDVMMKTYEKYSKGAKETKQLIDDFHKTFDDYIYATDITKLYKAYKKSEDNLKSMLEEDDYTKEQSDWLTNRIKQLDEFGMSAMVAGQEYRTWNDVIDATRDAVSTKWMTIYETIIGDLENQKALWTTIGTSFYDWFAQPLQDLNDKILLPWVEKGGRNSLIQGFKNIGDSISAIIKPIKQAFSNIFGSLKPETLVNITKKFELFTSKLIISKDISEKLKKVFTALFKIIKTGFQIFGGVVKIVIKFAKSLAPIGNLMLTIVSAFSAWISKTIDAAKKSFVLNKALEKLNKILTTINDLIKNAIGWIKKNLNLDRVVMFLKSVLAIIKKIGSVLGKTLKDLISSGGLQNVGEFINTGLKGGILFKILKFLSDFGKDSKDATGGFAELGEAIHRMFTKIGDTFEALTKKTNPNTLLNIAKALGIMAVSLYILGKVDENRLGAALGALTVGLIELASATAIMTKVMEYWDVNGQAFSSMIKMSVALLLLSIGMSKLAKLNTEQMGMAAIAITLLMSALTLCMDYLQQHQPEKGFKKVKGFVGIALGLYILALAMKKIADMQLYDIGKSMFALLGSLAIISVTLSKTDYKGAIKKSIGIVQFALSLVLIGAALKIVASIDWEDIKKGLLVIIGTMSVFLLVMNYLNAGNKKIVKGSSFSAGLFKGIKKGGFKTVDKSGGAIGKSAGLIGAAFSLILIGAALKIVASIPWKQLKVSLVAVNTVLGILSITLRELGKNSKGSLSGAASIFIVANSLIGLALALKIMGSIPVGNLLKAGAAVAGMFAILGIAALILKPLVTTILQLTVAMSLFSLATIGIGTGLVLIGAGIASIIAALSVGAVTIVAGVKAIFLGILDSLPQLIQIIKHILLAIFDLIIECTPQLAKAIFVTLSETLKILADNIPLIVELLADLIVSTLDALAKELPRVIVSAVKLLEAFFKGFIDALKVVDVSILLNGIVALGLVTAIMYLMAGLVVIAPLAAVGILAFGVLVIELSVVLGKLGEILNDKTLIDNINKAGDILEALGTAIGKLIGGFIGGLSAGFAKSLPDVANSLSEFMNNIKPFIEGVKQVNGQVLKGTGILAASIIAITATNLIANIGRVLSGGIAGYVMLGISLSAFMKSAKGFIDGAKSISPAVATGVKAISTAILSLTAANILDGLARFVTGGESSLAKFGEQLPDLGTKLSEFVTNLGTFTEDQVMTVNSAGQAILALANSAKALPNEGGWVAKIFGDNSLGGFSKDLPDVGTAIKGFVDNLGTFTDEQVKTADCASRVIVALADAADKIPNEGGLGAKIFGDNSLKEFAKNMPDVADGVNSFVNKLGDFKDKTEQVDAAANVIKGLAELGKLNLKEAKKNFPGFGDAITEFGTKLKGFLDIFASYSKESIQKASENVQLIVDAINGLVDTVIKTANNKTADLVTNFENIAIKMAKGMSSENVKKELDTQGKNFVSGFATSVTKYTYLGNNAVSKMMKSALETMRTTQDSNSPSKKTFKLGTYFSLGFINGIKTYSNRVYDESRNIGINAQEGLNKAIDTFDSMSNTNPTIRPILDLSDIESGANSLNNMFGNIGIGANINAIGNSMRQRNQNGDSEILASAIRDLNKNIGTSGNTYNINGITYDDGSSISDAVGMLIRAANIERRI